jgi:hypothetical protein
MYYVQINLRLKIIILEELGEHENDIGPEFPVPETRTPIDHIIKTKVKH